MGEVRTYDAEAFITKFGGVIEHCPMIAASVWAQGPFTDAHDLHQAICRLLDSMPSIGE